MRKNKIMWSGILVLSLLLLAGYSIWGFGYIKKAYSSPYNQGYFYRGMMQGWNNLNNNRQDYSNQEKLSIDQIKNNVQEYIKSYGNNLIISDIFIYKDSDYYVSVEEKDTGKGAMELLVNPYTGYIYPEYGPNMMWNEKYGMHGSSGYGMMGSGMMGGYPTNRDYLYNGQNGTNKLSKDEAVKAADQYVKSNVNKDFSVLSDGHEFYGYYTFHISSDNKTIGMVSVNYHTGAVWYHNWHGQLENVISNNKE